MKVPSYFKPQIGMRVKKRFDGTIYYGTITSGPFPVFNRKTQKEEDSWSILFDNEDEQDMNLEEVYQCNCMDRNESPHLIEAETQMSNNQRLCKRHYIALLLALSVEPVEGDTTALKKQFDLVNT